MWIRFRCKFVGKWISFRCKSTINDPDVPEAFVGLSISGGGSRAANFGMAALEQLDQIGIPGVELAQIPQVAVELNRTIGLALLCHIDDDLQMQN